MQKGPDILFSLRNLGEIILDKWAFNICKKDGRLHRQQSFFILLGEVTVIFETSDSDNLRNAKE